MTKCFEILNGLPKTLWIITACDGERRGGLLATWVVPASIDDRNPAIMVSIATNHFTSQLIDNCGVFAVHLISANQQQMALDFATQTGANLDKFEGRPLVSGKLGAPILEQCIAYLECQVFARLESGDRILYWADIIDGSTVDYEEPLTDLQFIDGLERSQKEEIRQHREVDIEIQRPLAQNWRMTLPEILRPLHEPK